MHSILGWASFCMNYCINMAWHEDNQPVVLLRCNEAQVALIAAFRSSALLGLVSFIFLLTIPHRFSGVQVRRVCWPIKHSNTMVIEPAFGTFGSVGRCLNRLCWTVFSSLRSFLLLEHISLPNFFLPVNFAFKML